MHSGEVTVQKALENIKRCLFVLQLRRSPPIPEHLLVQPEEVLKGTRDVLWGLLWETLQAYPYANDWKDDGPSLGMSGKAGNDKRAVPGAVLSPKGALPYTPQDRRALDQSLAEYMHSLGLVTVTRGGVTTVAGKTESNKPDGDRDTDLPSWAQINKNKPSSLTAFEGVIRDGTLLCALCDQVLGLGHNSSFTSIASAGAADRNQPDHSLSSNTGRVDLSAKGAAPRPQQPLFRVGDRAPTVPHAPLVWNKVPQTFNQCTSNVRKAVSLLRELSTGLGHL